MGSRRVGEFVTTKIIRRRRATSNVNPASSAAGVDRFVGWFCDSGWIPWIVDLIWIHECEFDSRTRNGSGVEQHLSAGEAAAALKEQAEHKCVCVLEFSYFDFIMLSSNLTRNTRVFLALSLYP